jgi:hypothetical protein
MATNSTTNNTMTKNPARKLITYDVAIGLLAIFSLLLLIPIFFGNVSSQDRMVLIYSEDVLCLVFLFDFFRNLHLAPNKRRGCLMNNLTLARFVRPIDP